MSLPFLKQVYTHQYWKERFFGYFVFEVLAGITILYDTLTSPDGGIYPCGAPPSAALFMQFIWWIPCLIFVTFMIRNAHRENIEILSDGSIVTMSSYDQMVRNLVILMIGISSFILYGYPTVVGNAIACPIVFDTVVDVILENVYFSPRNSSTVTRMVHDKITGPIHLYANTHQWTVFILSVSIILMMIEFVVSLFEYGYWSEKIGEKTQREQAYTESCFAP